MKIALPTRENQIDAHFGHCEFFTVMTLDGKVVVETERVDSPAGCGCKSNIAHVLAEKGVKLMLAGNMGDGAVRVLNHVGIDVVRGCAGDVREVVEAWIAGNVQDNGEGCHAHDHNCQGH